MKNIKFSSLLALASILVFAHKAASQPVTMGSSLVSAPNISIDCAVQPVLDQNFNFVPASSNTADCTWRQSGVFGVLSGDTRFSSVPGDGTITSISVRSGPNPAPLRFSILRQLSTPGFGAEGQCCFFVNETVEVQPTPNTITTFPVNLPVQRNVLNGFYAIDLLAVSARSGTGSLPLLSTTGGASNAFQLTQLGSVNAGFFYPRVGAIPNDVGGGRREQGMPGIELLVQWTWVPSRTGGISGNVGASVAATNALVRRQRAEINVACNGNAVCNGVLQLLSGTAASAPRSTRATKTKIINYGKANYSIKAGKIKVVKISLNDKGKKALKTGVLQAYLQIKPKKGAAQTVSMMLTKK